MATAGLLPSVPHAAGQRFSAGTELVALQVSVTDEQRRYVPDLTAQDFGVFEEGIPQAVSVFAAATAPVDVMLLLDSSSSMTGRMPLAQAAAISFLQTLRPDDRAAVVLFNTRVHVTQPLSSDRCALEAAVRSAMPDGGTALHQAIYIGLRELAATRRRDPLLRRQALVVLTDGEDNANNLSFDQVLDEARRSAVTIFAIMPGLPTRPPSSFDRFSPPQPLVPFEMRALTEETGGRAFLPGRIEDLPGTYSDIAHELSRQYWLGYAPAPSRGGFRRVSVRVTTRPGLRARTRSGYIAPAPRRSAAGFGDGRPR